MQYHSYLPCTLFNLFLIPYEFTKRKVFKVHSTVNSKYIIYTRSWLLMDNNKSQHTIPQTKIVVSQLPIPWSRTHLAVSQLKTLFTIHWPCHLRLAKCISNNLTDHDAKYHSSVLLSVNFTWKIFIATTSSSPFHFLQKYFSYSLWEFLTAKCS